MKTTAVRQRWKSPSFYQVKYSCKLSIRSYSWVLHKGGFFESLESSQGIADFQVLEHLLAA